MKKKKLKLVGTKIRELTSLVGVIGGIEETEPYSFCGMCVPITAFSFCRC